MNGESLITAANALYGGGTTAPPEMVAPAVETPGSVAAGKLYADSPSEGPDTAAKAAPGVTEEAAALPADVTALRASEDNQLYSRIAGYDGVPLEAALDNIDASAEVKAASALEYRHMAADAGASADQASQVLATIQGFINTPPTLEQGAQMQSGAAELLTAKYGDEAQAMLDLAKRMVARDPRVHALLGRTGAGNDPRTVMTVVELAIKQRTEGRLK